jgi:hypothetical protein
MTELTKPPCGSGRRLEENLSCLTAATGEAGAKRRVGAMCATTIVVGPFH